MGQIILVGGFKGGTGKSTTAVNLLTCFAHDGYSVAGVDADDAQAMNSWSAVRAVSRETPPGKLAAGDIPPIDVSIKRGRGIRDYALSLAEKYDFVLVDAGGYDSDEARAILMIAHLFVVPMRPSFFNILTLGELDKVLSDANIFRDANGAGDLSGHVFSNNVAPGDKGFHRENLRINVEDYENLTPIDPVVVNRQAFQRGEAAGIGVIEMKPRDPKAATEVYAVYDTVLGLLGHVSRRYEKEQSA